MSIADELIARTERRDLTFGIVGLGYVGLPLALELARSGYTVLGYDVNAAVVEGVNAGRSHVKDVTDTQLAEVRGRLTASEISVLRAVALFLRQAGTTFSDRYVREALVAHPEVA